MKLLLGFPLIIGGFCGVVAGFFGSIIIEFPIIDVSGLELSVALGVFFLIVFLGGLYTVFLAE